MATSATRKQGGGVMDAMAEAYDAYCARIDERLRGLRRAKPPCGLCGHCSQTEVDGIGYCLAGWRDRLRRYREDGAGFPLTDVVDMGGDPPCEWELFE